MRGQEKLIALRNRGLCPAVVFLVDNRVPSECFDGLTVEIDGEDLASLDLRFLKGLRVSTSASTETRAREILESCKQAGASMVAVCHLPDRKQDQKETDYMELWNESAAARQH